MSDQSAIEWTDATWNPVTGCDRVSPGCAHCYALDLAARLKAMGNRRYQVDGDPKTSGPGFGVTLHQDVLEKPLHWKRPRMVFVNSMSDLFHEKIPDEFIARVFATMALAPQHTFQVLTKRPERMRDFFTRELEDDVGWLPGTHAKALIGDAISRVNPDLLRGERACHLYDYPDDVFDLEEGELGTGIPNVWLGVSIENRRFVDRADLLRQTPAAVRFISAEPLLGPLVWAPVADDAPVDHGPFLDLTGIDWLIVGGESGPKARRMDPQWVRELRDACDPGGHYKPTTAFFFKQWGGRTPKAGGRELDGRTWDEFPDVFTQRVAA